MGVEKQPRGGLLIGAAAVVHRQLIGPALHAFATAQIELARRVITGMAGHTLGRENRLHIAAVGDRFGLQQRRNKDEQRADKRPERHGSDP